MREQLIQYVELLFAGARNCEDIKQEILQNTLDRYDDLIAEGKVPEAAYRLAITGIGDISEILGTKPLPVPSGQPSAAEPEEEENPRRKLLRAIAVGLYIVSAIPLIVLSELFGWDILGLCCTLTIVAFATVILVFTGKKTPQEPEEERLEAEEDARKSPLAKSIGGLIWAIGLAVYFILSFSTFAWHITWVIFPILGALEDVVLELVRQKERTGTVAFPVESPSRKTIGKFIWVAGIFLFLAVSSATQLWAASWLILPITGAVKGLVNAILDYKEAVQNET